MEPKIIYEDKNVLAVNKPANLLVHSASARPVLADARTGLAESTLVDWLIKNYPEIKNVGDDPRLRPGIVHRLDKDTSGIMVIAKNQAAFEFLKKQFAERLVKKTYLTLVVGKIKNKTGIVDLPIGRSKSPLRRLASEKARGKLREAITEYKILESFGGKFTLVKAYPKTGRAHQIRVHLKAIGHPVVCDKLYSKKPQCPFGLSRQFLHAYSLEMTLPDGSRSRFEADLPDDLKKILKALRKEK
jgi:23S rRNA pseudouridine1911/1915/1917 synthase